MPKSMVNNVDRMSTFSWLIEINNNKINKKFIKNNKNNGNEGTFYNISWSIAQR